jgi:hypothetical protein
MRSLALVAAPLLLVACGGPSVMQEFYVSTSGREYPENRPYPEVLDAAVRESGEHDLECAGHVTTPTHVRSGRANYYQVDGCGRRATYIIENGVTKGAEIRFAVRLIGVMPMVPAADAGV